MYYKLIPFSLLLYSASCHSMELFLYSKLCPMELKVPKYLSYPEKYADFRLTRPYGKPLQSDFDCLPTEVIESYIKSFLSQCVAQKFKQKLLQYRKKLIKNDQVPHSISYQKKEFHYHDGRYILMPDIADYSMCDSRTYPLLEEYWVPNEPHLRLLSHISPELDVRFFISLADYNNGNKRNFMLARRMDEEFIVNKMLFGDDINSCLLSGDGKWLILNSSDQIEVGFINVYNPVLHALSFNNPIVDMATSHHSSLMAISEQRKVLLMMPNEYDAWLETSFNIKTIQFSPNDRFLLACGEEELLLCELKDVKMNSFALRPIIFFSSLQKAFFSHDSKRIVIAFKDGKLLFWNDFFNKRPINLQEAIWKMNDREVHHDPLIVWSKDSAFLFSLYPKQNTIWGISCMIRKAKNGKLLNGYSAFPNSTITQIGLTQNEDSIILITKKNGVGMLNLYDEIECKYIDFITKDAHWYQLCDLQRHIKNIKNTELLEIAQSLIKGMMREKK